MIEGRSVLGVILARGGSKGLPQKNVRDFAGKPLIAWTIEAGQHSHYIDRLILSSDKDEIIAVAEEYGCAAPFRRPETLAQDDTTSMDALLHAVDQVPDYDYVALLQPTSPLRTAEDIDATLEQCLVHEAPACVTVTRTDKPPEWMYTLTEGKKLQPVLDANEAAARRQDAETTYVLNGAVYVARTVWLRQTQTFVTSETLAHPMPPERSADVDTAIDLAWCEYLIERFHLSHE